MVEPTTPENFGSMGCRYVMNAAESAGFHVDYLRPGGAATSDYDVELVSVHHCTDFPRLKALPRRAAMRLVGGHPSVNNIRPAIPFGDAFCVGEGETWIVDALNRVAAGAKAADLADLPGTVVRELHELGGPIPPGNTVRPLPKHPPYLNRAGKGHSQTWYIEMARGCPFDCHYCELGWAWKYRPQKTEWLLHCIDSVDPKLSKKISLFAPDEASHPGYGDALRRIHERGLTTSFGSMRLDQLVKRPLPLKPNMLVRVGLDGLTEQTRFRVGKPLTDDAVWDYFRFMSDRGHASYKIFMIFGYPWEATDEIGAWASLWDRIARIPRRVNAHVRVKFTPFIPQPSTPLGRSEPNYNPETVGRILDWFERVGRPWSRPGWFVANDGIMSMRSHALQCRLTQGDERTLDGPCDWSAAETLRGYDIEY
jgi:radical SAM superfamily enzyme YgiQ (UPF0313 family)